MKKNLVLPITLSSIETRLTFLSLTSLSFAVPFFLGDSQFVTGALVNVALFSSAFLLPRKLFLPIIVFPSLGVLSRGLLFGSLTSFLVFFLPFIWLGNLSLILVFKKAFPHFGYIPSVLSAALIKLLVLFSFANLFFKSNIIPELFLKAMGINQLITACLGGLLAFLFFKRFSDGRN